MEIVRLSRADIIKGKNNIRYVYFEKLGGELPLRPLTDGQASQIEAVRTRGTVLKGMPKMDANGDVDVDGSDLDLTIDLEKASSASFEADALAVFYGIAETERNDQWTVNDVKRMQPVGIVNEIASVIYQMSGIKPKGRKVLEEAERFRQDQGGAPDITDAHDGVPTSRQD